MSAPGLSVLSSTDASSSQSRPPDRSFLSGALNGASTSASAPKRKAIDFDMLGGTKKKKKERDGGLTTKANQSRSELNSFSSSQPSQSTVFAVPKPVTAPMKGNAAADSIRPMPIQDTPIIDKNREMRADADKRRKTARSTRGKRASSSLGSGVISQPHPSVPESSFHKHLPQDLPEALRTRHLLVWCASRAAKSSDAGTDSQSASSASEKGKARATDSALPKLSAADTKLVKAVQEEVMKMLADGRIDTNVFSRLSEAEAPHSGEWKEHEQNVKNRRRERDFLAEIEQAKLEDSLWAEVIQTYNTQQANALASLSQKDTSLARSTSKGKGKAKDFDDWEPWDNELDDHWREASGIARKAIESLRASTTNNVTSTSTRAQYLSPVSRRIGDLEPQSDVLNETVGTASRMADAVRSKLDAIFTDLSATLQSRGPGSSSALTKLVPSSAQPQDAMHLLRGISGLDASRPDSQVSEPARRTRRTVAAANGESTVNKYTAVAAPTPTPRRTATTPRRTPHTGKGS